MMDGNKSMHWEERVAQIKTCVADAVKAMGGALEILEQEPDGPGAEEWQHAQEAMDDAAECLRQAALSCVFALAERADQEGEAEAV